MLGYCNFAQSYCYHVLNDGNCVYDSINKCDNPSVIEALGMRKEETMFDGFRTHKYVENEPPKPNHDLVEVTRCKNCEYWDKEPSCSAFPEFHNCGFWWINHIATKADEFCSHGAKKLEENWE